MALFSSARAAAATLLLAGSLTAPAFAQPAPSMMINGSAANPSNLIRVNSCAPERQRSSLYGSYAPGFYPAGPFFWNDPYGYSYQQFPLAPASGTLSINYMNVTHKVMKTIDFGLVANGRLVAEVRDVGTFSPNAEIQHSFGLDPNVFPLRTALSQCVPLRIVYADGTTWTNPHLPSPGGPVMKHRHKHRG